MNWAEEDGRFVEAVSTEIEDYLSSKVLSWPLKNAVGTLTPGNLLLTMKRLRRAQNEDDCGQTQDIIDQINQFTQNRQSLWQKKIIEEIPYRLKLWSNSLEDYLEDGIIDSSYGTQIKNRVISELLSEEVRFFHAEWEESLQTADQILKKISREGEFVWDVILANEFPRDRFWYLYLKINEVIG